MKRLILPIILILLSIFYVSSAYSQQQDISLKEKVKIDVIGEINSGIMSEVQVDRLAVYAFTNDKNSEITNALITELRKSGMFTILDRSEPDEYQAEVEKLLNPMYDKSVAVGLGNNLTAEAVVIGNIKEFSSILGTAKLSVYVRVIDLKTGEILWTDDNVFAKAESGFGRNKYYILLGIIFVILLIILIVRISRKEIKIRLGEDEKIRRKFQGELNQALRYLSESRDIFFKKGEKELASSIREVENDMSLFKDRIKNAEFGSPDVTDYRGAKGTKKFAQKIAGCFTDINQHCHELFRKAQEEDIDTASSMIQQLKMKVIELEDIFKERKNIMNGV